jgi:hypothetical protein
MLAPPHIRPSEDKNAAAVLVELLKPGAWIPPAQARWLPVIEALLEAFPRHFDRAVLASFPSVTYGVANDHTLIGQINGVTLVGEKNSKRGRHTHADG